MAKRITGTLQESFMSLPKLMTIALFGGVIALILGMGTTMITDAFNVAGDLGISIIATILALTVFTFSMSMKKKFNIVKDLIPVLIVSPLVVAVLTALNLTGIPVVSSSVEISASLGVTLASVIFANNTLKNIGLFD